MRNMKALSSGLRILSVNIRWRILRLVKTSENVAMSMVYINGLLLTMSNGGDTPSSCSPGCAMLDSHFQFS